MNNQKAQKQSKKLTVGRVINFRPAFTFALFLIFGIIVAYVQSVQERSVWWLTLLALVSPLPFFFFAGRKLRFLIYLAVLYSAFAIGLFSFTFRVSSYEAANHYSGVHTVTGTVVDISPTAQGKQVVLDKLTVNGVKERGALTLVLQDDSGYSVRHCDRIQLDCTLSTNAMVEGKYGFRAEAIAGGSLYRASKLTELKIIDFDFRLGAYLRGEICSTVTACMGEESAAVTTAMLLGNTSGIEEGLLENVRYGGIAHIFAVSGLHIGCVFAVCLFFLRRNRIPAPVRFLIVAISLLLYGGICGYSASVVRAIVTCLVTYGCSLLGIKYDSLESLSLAACVVLIIYPTLLFGLGMQLSFAACAGIILLSRHMGKAFSWTGNGVADFIEYKICRRPKPRQKDMFHGNTLPKPLVRQAIEGFGSFMAVSLSAQLGTLPILYVRFGYLSLASVGLNVLFVPLVSVCFAALLILVLLACVLPTEWGTVLLYVPDTLLHAVMLPFHTANFREGAVRSVVFGTEAIICYYAGLAFCTDKLNFSKWHKRLFVLFFLTAFVVCLIVPSLM